MLVEKKKTGDFPESAHWLLPYYDALLEFILACGVLGFAIFQVSVDDLCGALLSANKNCLPTHDKATISQHLIHSIFTLKEFREHGLPDPKEKDDKERQSEHDWALTFTRQLVYVGDKVLSKPEPLPYYKRDLARVSTETERAAAKKQKRENKELLK
jgi:hypothetical protein